MTIIKNISLISNCENENTKLKIYLEKNGEYENYKIYHCLITCGSNEKISGKECLG